MIAAFFSLVIRDPEKEDTNEPSAIHLQKDEEYLHRRLTEDELNDPQKLAQLENEIEGEENEDEVRPDEMRINEARATRLELAK